MRRHRLGERPQAKRKKMFFFLVIIIGLGSIFVPGPNGLAKVIYKSYKKQQLQRQIEQFKIKAELIEAKIARGKDENYLRKYLQDNYNMVSKDSIEK